MRPFLLALFAALVLAGTAQASPSVRYGLQDDAWLGYGPGTLESRLDRLDSLGVRLVRFNLHWSEVAPTRPASPRSPADAAYRWQRVDPILEGLREHGIAVVLGLVSTPRWANGGRSDNWAPARPSLFGDFAYAAARRYSWVRDWLAWNEPNQRRWLRPTTAATYVRLLLNPAYSAIHRALQTARVAGGVTAPRAASGGVSPVAWIAGMRQAGARLDAYAHHPYPSMPRAETPFKGGCDHCTTITMATLERLLSAVTAAWGPKRIWLTEYGYQTRPPDPYLGVSPGLQARYIGEAALRARLAPRVDMLIQYLYRDEPELDRFQSGLVFLSGAAKPSLAAFRLPLAQVSRAGQAVTLWGEVRPGAGVRSFRLEQQRAGRWIAVGGTRATDARGGFRATLQAPAGTLVRARTTDGGVVSPPLVVG